MATTTTNFGWDIPQSTDLVKDGATAIAALGQDIDTAFIDLKGGTTGQVLAKASNTDLDYSWVAQDDSNAIQNAIVDAKGDLIAATAADTPARLAVGTNGQVLTADSTAATGLKWATSASGGMTSIASGSLSGSSLSLTTISGSYKNLQLVIRDVATATDDNYVLLRLNGDSGANRHGSVSANSGDYTVNFNNTQITINGGIDNAVFDGLTIVDIPDYANTVTQKIAPYRGLYTFYDAGTKIIVNGTIFYNQTSAISSLEIRILYGTFSGGTALLYGVA